MLEDYTFEQEKELYNKNINEWLPKYTFKFVVIKHKELVGFFDTSAEACDEGYRRFGRAPFMVCQIGMQSGELTPLHRGEIIYGGTSATPRTCTENAERAGGALPQA